MLNISHAEHVIIFDDKGPLESEIGTWGGTSKIESQNKVVAKGKKALEVILNNPSDYSGCHIDFNKPIDLSEDFNTKFISFWIKGFKGGEPIIVLIKDSEKGDGDYDYDVTVELEKYAKVTTEWQQVFIPLKDLPGIGVNGTDPPTDNLHHKGIFDWKEVTSVIFMLSKQDISFYLDDIIIASTEDDKTLPELTEPLSVNKEAVEQ